MSDMMADVNVAFIAISPWLVLLARRRSLAQQDTFTLEEELVNYRFTAVTYGMVAIIIGSKFYMPMDLEGLA
jgi:hypothetical protein